jgi:hypothetical protein
VPTPNGPVAPGRSAQVGTSHDHDADRLNEQSLSQSSGS